jgi:hypothetical protein
MLRWRGLDWDKGRMTVRSPKTEGIEEHESRVVPLFPELRASCWRGSNGPSPGPSS